MIDNSLQRVADLKGFDFGEPTFGGDPEFELPPEQVQMRRQPHKRPPSERRGLALDDVRGP